MPGSVKEARPWLLERYKERRPDTVVDVGPGAGTYAKAFRPVYSGFWTAVEIWEPYVAQYRLWDYYDRIIVDDVREIEMPPADLYIFGDVLEHMPRDDAIAILSKARDVASQIVVSVPIIHLNQGAAHGNPFETHRYHWKYDEMADVLGTAVGYRGRIVGAWYIDT